jgi:hypothetical protein
MTGNSDILLGYFDSLLAPCPADESGEHPLDSLLLDATAPYAGEADTVASGYRLIALMLPGTPLGRAAALTLNLELLCRLRKLEPGRLHSSMLAACEPEHWYG